MAIVFIIDRAIRLSDRCSSTDSDINTLIPAYTLTWVRSHGAAKQLYCDGEAPANTVVAIEQYTRLGIEVRIRAPQQHARVVEARNAMFRHVMHVTNEDLVRAGHPVSLERVYVKTITVVNVFSFYNGLSPYDVPHRQTTCVFARS